MEDFILKHSLGESLFYGRFPEQIDLLFSQGLCQGFLQMTSKGKNKHISFPLVVCFLGRHFADVGDFQSIAYLGLQPSPAPCFHCWTDLEGSLWLQVLLLCEQRGPKAGSRGSPDAPLAAGSPEWAPCFHPTPKAAPQPGDAHPQWGRNGGWNHRLSCCEPTPCKAGLVNRAPDPNRSLPVHGMLHLPRFWAFFSLAVFPPPITPWPPALGSETWRDWRSSDGLSKKFSFLPVTHPPTEVSAVQKGNVYLQGWSESNILQVSGLDNKMSLQASYLCKYLGSLFNNHLLPHFTFIYSCR